VEDFTLKRSHFCRVALAQAYIDLTFASRISKPGNESELGKHIRNGCIVMAVENACPMIWSFVRPIRIIKVFKKYRGDTVKGLH